VRGIEIAERRDLAAIAEGEPVNRRLRAIEIVCGTMRLLPSRKVNTWTAESCRRRGPVRATLPEYRTVATTLSPAAEDFRDGHAVDGSERRGSWKERVVLLPGHNMCR